MFHLNFSLFSSVEIQCIIFSLSKWRVFLIKLNKIHTFIFIWARLIFMPWYLFEWHFLSSNRTNELSAKFADARKTKAIFKWLSLSFQRWMCSSWILISMFSDSNFDLPSPLDSDNKYGIFIWARNQQSKPILWPFSSWISRVSDHIQFHKQIHEPNDLSNEMNFIFWAIDFRTSLNKFITYANMHTVKIFVYANCVRYHRFFVEIAKFIVVRHLSMSNFILHIDSFTSFPLCIKWI